MKALKYGLTLILGLSMVCGASVWAQEAGQAAQTGSEWRPKHEAPRLPDAINNLLTSGAYTKAEAEFEKYMKTVKFDACDMIYVPYMFYSRLLEEDTTSTALYQEKVDAYANQYLQSCGNTFEAYMMRINKTDPQDFDAIVTLVTAAMQIEPDATFLYGMRGSALWQLQRTEEACADYKKAKELDESYADYYDTQCVKPEEAQDAAAEPAPAE